MDAMSRPGRPPTGGPTLKDIVHKTGYGLMTVSRALGPQAHLVHPQKRAHIRAVAEELGYRPNLNIRALRQGTGSLVGVFCERLDGRAHDLLIGLHDALVPQGLLPFLLISEHHPRREGTSGVTAAIRHLVERRVAAVVALLPEPDRLPPWLPELVDEVYGSGIPLVAVGGVLPTAPVPLVACDLPQVMDLLLDHVAARGRGVALAHPATDPWSAGLDRLLTAAAGSRGLLVQAWDPATGRPKDFVPVTTAEHLVPSLLAHQDPEPCWISGGDPSTTAVAGLAVDLDYRGLGARVVNLLIEAFAGGGLPERLDHPPRPRRCS